MSKATHYPAIFKVLASAHYNMNFETDETVNQFIQKYGLEDQIDRPNKEFAKLKAPVATELLKVSKLFLSENDQMDKRTQFVSDAVTSDLKAEFAKQFPGSPAQFSPVVSISTDEYGGTFRATVNVEITVGNDETEDTHEFDIPSLSYSAEPGLQLTEYAESGGETGANWAAWLGDSESPFYDSSFSDSYDEDQASIALEQFYATREETSYASEIANIVKEAMDGYVSDYKFIVDADERGMFRAHVEDASGKTVYELSNEDENGNEGELPQVADGFMKHAKDVAGLAAYLKEMNILPADAQLIEGN